jgi:hypothetical protein
MAAGGGDGGVADLQMLDRHFAAARQDLRAGRETENERRLREIGTWDDVKLPK